MSPQLPRLRRQPQQQQRSLASSTTSFLALIPWTIAYFILAKSTASASPLSSKKDRKSTNGNIIVKSPSYRDRQRGRHQLAHQVHHVQLVDESVHNTPVLMNKSARKRKRLQLQKQQQQKRHLSQNDKSDAKRVHPVKRDDDDDEKAPDATPKDVVRAPDTPARVESASANSITARDPDDTSDTTSNIAAVANPLGQYEPFLHDSVPGIEINDKIGDIASNNEKQPSPQKRVAISKASVPNHGNPHKKKGNSNSSRAKLLSAYESIIFSESQIPVFLRRQDDFRQRGLRLKKSGGPETKAKSQKKNSHGLRPDDSHKKKRDRLSSGTSRKINNDEAKMGVVVTPPSFLDISGVNTNAEVKDGLEHNINTNTNTKNIDKNSNIDSLNRNHIVEISDPDPKITEDDALYVEEQRERSARKTMVTQGQDLALSRKTFPRPPEQQRYSWEQEGEEQASGRALECHQRIPQGHHGLPPSEQFLSECGFDTTAAWILLLGLVVSAIIVMKVFYVPRQRRQSSPSTNVEHPKDPAQVPLMKDHSVYTAE